MSIVTESVAAATVTGGASPLAVWAVGSGAVPVVPVPGVVAALESHEIVESEPAPVEELDPVPAPLEDAAHGVTVCGPVEPDEAEVVPEDASLVPLTVVVVVATVALGPLISVDDVPDVATVVVGGAVTVLESVLPTVAVAVGGAVLVTVVVDDGGAVVASVGPLTVAVVVGALVARDADVEAGASLAVTVVEGSSEAEKNWRSPPVEEEETVAAPE